MSTSKKKTRKTTTIRNKLALDMSLKRIDHNIILNIKCDNAIEELFKVLSDNSKSTSGAYTDESGNPHKFYKTLDSSSYSYQHGESELMDYLNKHYNQYGYSLMKYNDGVLLPNISILRTVGISKGITIKVDNRYSEESIRGFVIELHKFIANFYKSFIKPVNLKATLEIDRL